MRNYILKGMPQRTPTRATQLMQLYNSVALSSGTAECIFSTVRPAKSNVTASSLSNNILANLHVESIN